jgi:hypothetical protein
MTINRTDEHNLLFRWASKGLKFLLLTLLGFAIACILSHVFGAVSVVGMLLSRSIWQWIFRLAVFIFCMFASAMIIESWR